VAIGPLNQKIIQPEVGALITVVISGRHTHATTGVESVDISYRAICKLNGH
jgi:hypothetical protein